MLLCTTLFMEETVRAIVEKVRYDEPLVPLTLSIVKQALVVGGGIAGVTAALEIADAGYPVVLVERSAHLGGRMAQLSRLYLNFDDSENLLEKRIEAATHHPLIEVLTNAEVTGFEGYVGNFRVDVTPRLVSEELVDSGLANPVSAELSNRGSTNLRTYEVGAVVLATGFDLYAQENLPEYGGGRYPDVIDSLQFEAMLKTGQIRRPSALRLPTTMPKLKPRG